MSTHASPKDAHTPPVYLVVTGPIDPNTGYPAWATLDTDADDNIYLAEIPMPTHSNVAELQEIVRKANAHADLLAALEDAERFMARHQGNPQDVIPLVAARAAIAKAVTS